MNKPTLETNERISQRFFNMTLDLVRQLEAEDDQEGLETLPTVIITTGVMAMCRSVPVNTVVAVLNALSLKVERGDFNSPRGLEKDVV